ncbi:hypothetical protein EJC51_46970 [Streptomyces aquilus]|uniref:Uncharacterized protein n=1 Tax=Streptomyces aquilus TaxID=2548456 RepID=A0A3Q9C7R1_9ACTN|nr:hypothetical protein EJC51_46970 [Streptomyces aquilus]
MASRLFDPALLALGVLASRSTTRVTASTSDLTPIVQSLRAVSEYCVFSNVASPAKCAGWPVRVTQDHPVRACSSGLVGGEGVVPKRRSRRV